MEALTSAGVDTLVEVGPAMCSVASRSVRCVASPATSWPMPAISAFERAQLQDHDRRRCCPGLPAPSPGVVYRLVSPSGVPLFRLVFRDAPRATHVPMHGPLVVANHGPTWTHPYWAMARATGGLHGRRTIPDSLLAD